MGVFWWIPALVPLIGALILLLCPLWPIARWQGARSEYEIRANWEKFTIYMVVNIVACILLSWGSWFGAVEKTKFPEVWNFQITGMRHEMQWTTEESYTVEVDDGDTTDSDGNVHHHSHSETRYRTDLHGPYWYSINEYGDESRIDESEYGQWKNVWRDEARTGIHRGSSAGFDRSIDGPIYSCSWPRTFETVYPDAEIHKYVNKIRVSHSILNHGSATPQQKARFPRPADQNNVSPVLVYGGLNTSAGDVLYLRRISASFGHRYEIHPILVVFGKDESRDVVADVLAAWQGPNKNELVTFLSLDGQMVRWVEVHSWMDDTTLHATLRDELMGKPFTINRYGELLRKYVPTLWHRKHFTSINAYLHVSIHPGWFFLALVLSIITGVVSYRVIDKQVEA